MTLWKRTANCLLELPFRFLQHKQKSVLFEKLSVESAQILSLVKWVSKCLCKTIRGRITMSQTMRSGFSICEVCADPKPVSALEAWKKRSCEEMRIRAKAVATRALRGLIHGLSVCTVKSKHGEFPNQSMFGAYRKYWVWRKLSLSVSDTTKFKQWTNQG